MAREHGVVDAAAGVRATDRPTVSPRAKRAPPEPARSLISRPRLESRLDEAFERRLVTVVAGPGFGKSTAVAAWAAQLEHAWYAVDGADDSLAVFSSGLADALGVPEVAQAEGPAGDERARTDALAGVLVGALDRRLSNDFFLVLDDLHELDANSASARLVEALCRQTPRLLHLVLVSRAEPPFPIQRLRGRGQVMSLAPAELAFEVEEVRALLQNVAGATTSELAPSLHELTGGWPAAVRLGAEALRGSPEDGPRTLEAARHAGGSLFAYLAEEVFASAPETVRTFLRVAALFDRASVDLCGALGISGAADIVADLAERTLFVQREPGPGGWFTVHALVRDFACEEWPFDAGELRGLRRRAGEWFEIQGDLGDALRSFMEADDPTTIARFLATNGAALVFHAARLVLDAGARIPTEMRTHELETLLALASVHLGERESALEYSRRALAHGKPSLKLGVALGAIYSGTNLEEALQWYERALRTDGEPRDKAMVLSGMASAHFQLGDVSACAEAARRLDDLAAQHADVRITIRARHAAALAATLAGDVALAEARYHSALALADEDGDAEYAGLGRNNLGSILAEQHRLDESLEQLTRGLEIVEAAPIRPGVRGLLLYGRGETHHRAGRLDEAARDYRAAQGIFERMGSRFAAGAIAGLGQLSGDRGELALARAACEEAASLAERFGNVHLARWALWGLARVVAADDGEAAMRTAERAIGLGRGENDAWPLLTAAWIAQCSGRDASAYTNGAEASAKRRRDHGALADVLALRALADGDAKLLEEAASIWRTLGSRPAILRAEYALARIRGDHIGARRARRLLERLGVRVDAAARAAGLLMALGPERPPPLAIQALGGFRVLRGGVVAPASEWQSKKARELVKILVARRGRPVPRELLIEALWPGEDPARTANRLSVALSTARGVLDPERRFPPDTFVRASNEAVALEPGSVVVDVEAFLSEADAGLAASRDGRTEESVELLEAAEAAYAGDFLEEDAYEDWAAPLREEARAAYLAVVRTLAEHAEAGGDSDGAIRYRLRALERDPYDEGTHLGLVETLAGAGRHGEARRAYRAYVARSEEIGIEPAPLPAVHTRG